MFSTREIILCHSLLNHGVSEEELLSILRISRNKLYDCLCHALQSGEIEPACIHRLLDGALLPVIREVIDKVDWREDWTGFCSALYVMSPGFRPSNDTIKLHLAYLFQKEIHISTLF